MNYLEESEKSDEFGDIDIVTKIAAFLYAKRFNDDVPFEDYKHFGFIGYLEAKKNFDPGKGASFRTFANFRIKGAILNGISKFTEKLNITHYRKNSKKHLALFIKSDNYEDRFEYFSSYVVEFSLESLIEDVFDSMFTDPEVCENNILENESAVKLLDGLDGLLDVEMTVVLYHYFYDFPFKDIAEYMNLSKGRVSQIHSVALKKLLNQLSIDDSFSSYL